jgi:DNA-binding SARP family transcriptional activator
VSEEALELRFLGEMEMVRGGERLELPPSRKTRALLAYLALTGRPHRRDRLCGLLWDVADDPRGALRWSLSRLRAIVDEPGRPRIRAPRDSVAFDAQGARIDVIALKERCAAGLDGAPVDELAALAREFRGELLEGLDVGEFLDFQAWCVAEREEARKVQARVLRVLVERLAGDPEAALPHARTLATIDPLDEPVRASLVRLLTATGRRREAEQQYDAAKRLLQEFGTGGSGALEAAWRGSRDGAPRARAAREPAALPSPCTAECMVGRVPERGRLGRAVEDAVQHRREHVLLVTGEPGLGKTRLLDELGGTVRERGGTVLEGRAFEAEAGRPFGPWIDALRQLSPDAVVPGLGADLVALLPEQAGGAGTPQSRDRLFAAVLELLGARASHAPPVLLAFDDVHWLDAASAELLHYVARMSRHRRLIVALTARAGELFDNDPVQRALRGLREMRLLEEVPLGPLGPEETRELVVGLAPGIDADRVFAESAGNPLFAIEVARSLSDGEGPLPGSLAELVRHRLDRLPSEAGDVLRWAAVLGGAFGADRLGELTALDIDRLLAALQLLERHALLRAAHREGASGYEFAHEVVRRVVYSSLSQPRRRLMHLRVAERLGHSGDPQAAAAELAHHAALAGESALAARACAAAGRRFLRQFANEDARTVARRGRRHAADVAEPERTRLLVELLQVELQAQRPADTSAAAAELEQLAERALEQASAEHARLGFHLLAWLRWEEGDLADAQKHMMRAELVSRAGDEQAQVVAIAEAARCLALLERELPRAEAMALEATARSARAGGLRPSAIADAQGMLRQHQGRLREAAELFEQARLEARQASDPLGEFQALEHLVVLRQQERAWPEAARLGAELETLAGKLRKGSEGPFARALVALSHDALGAPDAAPALEAAIAELRVADAKARLAYVLTRAAQLDLERGEAGRARARSDEARRMAATVGRPTEELLAGVTLARACLRTGDAGAARAIAGELGSPAYAGSAAPARRELESLLREQAGAKRKRAGTVASRQEGRA